MLALASLHFLHSTGPHPTYQPSQGREKIKEKQLQQQQQHMQPQCEQCPSTPTWLTVHEIELIGVIDQKAPAPERTGRRVGAPCVLPD